MKWKKKSHNIEVENTRERCSEEMSMSSEYAQIDNLCKEMSDETPSIV